VSISSISSSAPQYQVPTTPQAKAGDERTESQTVRNQEAETGKEKSVALKAQAVDIKA